jgi:hypothetical protein
MAVSPFRTWGQRLKTGQTHKAYFSEYHCHEFCQELKIQVFLKSSGCLENRNGYNGS